MWAAPEKEREGDRVFNIQEIYFLFFYSAVTLEAE